MDIISLIIFGIALLLGIFLVADTEGAWHLFMSWLSEDGSPSDRALRWIKIDGIAIIVISVIRIASVILAVF